MLFSPVWFLIIRFYLYYALRRKFFLFLAYLPLLCHICFLNISIVQESFTCYPSATPLGLTLGPDLPWADEPSPRNLRLSTARILTLLSLLIPAFSLLSRPAVLSINLRPTIECSSTTHILLYEFAISVNSLAPVIFRATSLDQWAITHSLNEWLLLSQHPGCLRKITSFST